METDLAYIQSLADEFVSLTYGDEKPEQYDAYHIQEGIDHVKRKLEDLKWVLVELNTWKRQVE